MGVLWAYSGYTVGTMWVIYFVGVLREQAIVSIRWAYCGCMWVCCGYTVGTLRVYCGHCGCIVSILWAYCGYDVGTLWVYCGHTVGAL